MSLLVGSCPQYEEAFAEVAAGFTQLITNHREPLSKQRWMKLYQHIFHICSNSIDPRPHDLYRDIKALLTRHCRSVLGNLQRLQLDGLLAGYLQAHDSFFFGMVCVRQLAEYLSRHWIKMQLAMNDGADADDDIFSFEHLPFLLWQDELLLKLHPTLFEAVNLVVSGFRTGMLSGRLRTDFSQLKRVIETLLQVEAKTAECVAHDLCFVDRAYGRRIYALGFEERFLQHTMQYYTTAGNDLVAAGRSGGEYVAAVEPLLHREQQWGERWLPESTRKKCSAVCYTALVAPHRSDLCSCVPSLLRNGQHIPAGRVYELLRQTAGDLEDFCAMLRAHVVSTGAAQRSQNEEGAADPKTIVASTWQLLDSSKQLVAHAFDGDDDCQAAISAGIRTWLNQEAARHSQGSATACTAVAEELARFAHNAVNRSAGSTHRLPSKSSHDSPERHRIDREQSPTAAAQLVGLGGSRNKEGASGKQRQGKTVGPAEAEVGTGDIDDDGVDVNRGSLGQELAMLRDLLPYVDEKSALCAATCRYMAKRLLQGSSLSMVHEQALVMAFKEAGSIAGGAGLEILDTTRLLQRMCNDKLLAPKLTARFIDWRRPQNSSPLQNEAKLVADGTNPTLTPPHPSDRQMDSPSQSTEKSASAISGDAVSVQRLSDSGTPPPMDDIFEGAKDGLVSSGHSSISLSRTGDVRAQNTVETSEIAIELVSPEDTVTNTKSEENPGVKTKAEHKVADAKSRESSPPVSVQMLVLTAGAWPVTSQQSTIHFKLPVELVRWQLDFENFYLEMFGSGRKLSWLHHLSKAEVYYTPIPQNIVANAGPVAGATGTGVRKPYELVGTVHQMAALLLFDSLPPTSQHSCDHPELTVGQMAAALGFSVVLTGRLLKSLYVAQLIQIGDHSASVATSKGNMTRDSIAEQSWPTKIDTNTIVRLDVSSGFAPAKRRVKLPVASFGNAASQDTAGRRDSRKTGARSSGDTGDRRNTARSGPYSRSEHGTRTKLQTADERKMCTQAAIVRILKRRREMSHEELMAAVSAELASRFGREEAHATADGSTAPDRHDIKQNIDRLIDREYLTRKPGDMNVYMYLA